MTTPRDAATEPGGAEWGEAPVALGVTMGRYRLRAVVGAGGMGVVFEALDPELARSVAVKVLRTAAGQDSEGAARLRREGQTMAQLTHPNVIRVYDVGVAHGHAFVAMEFVDGMTLGGWLGADAEPRSVTEILAVFVQAGRGLAAAHERDLVHRDFKPGNVLVGTDGRVLVTDFGLARTALPGGPDPDPVVRSSGAAAPAASVTVTGQFVGTPAYMAPEQYSTAQVDARADQFSFCVALWRALFGTAPYAGTTVDELVAAAEANQLVPPPAAAAARVPPAIRAALERGLRGDRAERFGSMPELLAVLEPRPARRPIVAVVAGIAAVAAVVAIWAVASSHRAGGVNAPARDAAPRGSAVVEAVAIDAARAAAVDTTGHDAAPAEEARSGTPRPEHLPDNADDDDGVSPVLDALVRRMQTCGPWTTEDGFEARFDIDPHGAVTNLDLHGPDHAIATCMKQILVGGQFPRSKFGGSVSSSFVRR